ncbi:29632_t:CDS:2, partial [Racocetra persica]
VENSLNQQEGVQRFFFVLRPQQQNKYRLLVVGKKQLPPSKKDSYFLFLEAIKNNKEELLSALQEKHYSTKTRGERTLPVSQCLGIKATQKEFNLQKEDDFLISIKNPQATTPPRVGLSTKQKVKFPPSLQVKLANYSFAPLTTSEFLDYEGVELLLIAKDKTNLTGREKGIEHCLEKINPDNLVD